MFGDNGGLPRFTIGNPKYPEGLRCLDPLPHGFNGCPTKILSTCLGISICTFTRFVPLGVYGLEIIPTIIWAGVVVNGTLVTVTIDWGIATKYYGTNLTGPTLKFEVFA